MEIPTPPKPEVVVPKPPRSRYKKIIITCLIILVGLFIILRPTLVVDGKTYMPITGADVMYYKNTWDGCSKDPIRKSFLGISFPGFRVFPPCQITVSKEGYHVNGANSIKNLPGIFGFRIVRLNKINNPQENFVQFNRVFTEEYPGMNVPAYMAKVNAGVNPNETKNDIDTDFIFTVIGNDSPAANTVGRSILEIEFFGDGGVQSISQDSAGDDGGAEYYDMENLLEAPIDGYKKSMKIEEGKSYIARLKDGKHYMKFYVFGSKNYENNTSYVCMTGYIQPLESRNLEFVDVYENIYCSDDSTENDNIHAIYSKLKKQMTGKNSVLVVSVIDDYIDQLGLRNNPNEYNFIALSNNNRFTNVADPISVSVLRTMEIDVELPAFEVFKQRVPSYQYVPVDLFLNGKYIDPKNIIED